MKIKFLKIISIIFIFSLTVSLIPVGVFNFNSNVAQALSTKLIQSTDLVKLGSFGTPNVTGTLSDGTVVYETTYPNVSIAFNPANQSLFMTGHDWGQHIAEISIPAYGGTSSIIQSFRDALYGKLESIAPCCQTASDKIGGLYVNGSNLLVSGYVYYDGSGTASQASHFSRSTNLSDSNVIGAFRVGTLNPAFYGGYFTDVPTEWQILLGGDMIVGQCCLSIISRTSFGPAASALKRSDLIAGTNPTTAQSLVYYDQAHETLGWTNGPLITYGTAVRGGVIPPGSASLLLFGQTGLGKACYGIGVSSNPANPPVAPDLATGLNASTDSTGIIVTLPFADTNSIAGPNYPNDGLTIWLKNQTSPNLDGEHAGVATTIGNSAANSGTATASVRVRQAYAPNLTNQPYNAGELDCYDPTSDAKGGHAYPYSGYVWAYNLNDLAAVKAGTKNPWDVIPYGTWTLPESVIGGAYDSATGRIFLSTYGSNMGVSVYSINGSATPIPGDINLDHIVNSIDYSIMNSQWFTSNPQSDLNKDGIVNSLDYSIMNSNWFKTW
jgi:hypothetical protein